jgi:hypothetical protein
MSLSAVSSPTWDSSAFLDRVATPSLSSIPFEKRSLHERFGTLLSRMLTYYPISAQEALQHPFFEGIDFTQKEVVLNM